MDSHSMETKPQQPPISAWLGLQSSKRSQPALEQVRSGNGSLVNPPGDAEQARDRQKSKREQGEEKQENINEEPGQWGWLTGESTQ